MEYTNEVSCGLVIDGVLGSEAIDSTGETLDVKGCDISTLEEGQGVLNYEHADKKRPGASFIDIVGRILYAKKIYSVDDCDDERQLEYWSKVKVPYIYIQIELFDSEAHPGAVALAAVMRHYHKRGLPILVRYSVEGHTLEREGNRLIRTIAKGAASTITPANKTSLSGILYDPKEKNTKESKKIYESLTERLTKSLPVGCSGSAPGVKIQGEALSKDQVAIIFKIASGFSGGSKDDFRSYLKNHLPELSDSYVDHFVDLIDEYKIRKLKSLIKADLEYSHKNSFGKTDTSPSVAHSGYRLNFLNNPDDQYSSHAFHDAIRSDHVQRTWRDTMKNWLHIHHLSNSGELPDSIVRSASLIPITKQTTDPGLLNALDSKVTDILGYFLNRRNNDPDKYHLLYRHVTDRVADVLGIGHLVKEDAYHKSGRFANALMGRGNLTVPDETFVRHLFNLPKENESEAKGIKEYLWDPSNRSKLKDIEQQYMKYHPAFKYVDQDPMFAGLSKEQKLFPAFLLHWLAIPEHEKMLGGDISPQGHRHERLHEISAILERHGLPAIPENHLFKSETYGDRLIKAEGSDVAPIAVRISRVMHALAYELGPTVAQYVYHRFLIHVLMSKHQVTPKQESVANMYAAKETGKFLQKLPPLHKAENVVMFKGKPVHPGIIEYISGPFKGNKVPFYHEELGYRYAAAPDGSNETRKLRVNHENRVYKVIKKPIEAKEQVEVHGDLDGIPGFVDTPEQMALVHNLDLSNSQLNPKDSKPGQTDGTSWHKISTGDYVFVKPSLHDSYSERAIPFIHDFSTARREALFYELAKGVFKCEEYVPITAAFIHPRTHIEYSAQIGILQGNHVDLGYDSKALQVTPTNQHLADLGNIGILHKLAVMDYIMGVKDRNIGNYLIDPKTAGHDGIWLIDNATSLCYDEFMVPDYLIRYLEIVQKDDTAIMSPMAVELALNLDVEKLALHLAGHGVSLKIVEQMMKRVHDLRLRIAVNKLSIKDILGK
jgi:hypothetical protein